MGLLYVSLAESQRKPDEPEFGDGVLLMFSVLWHLLCIAVLLVVAVLILFYQAVRWLFGRRPARTPPPNDEPEVWRYGY